MITTDLSEREYLTPNEAKRVFGRSAAFFRDAYDEGLIKGYRTGGEGQKHRTRHLKRDSIREFLDSGAKRPEVNYCQEVKEAEEEEKRAIAESRR